MFRDGESLMGNSHDDAPLLASKRSDAADDLPVESKGDGLTGATVTIRKPRDELYSIWRDFSRFPDFMENVERVDVLDETYSHWVVKAPGGRTVEWNARI